MCVAMCTMYVTVFMRIRMYNIYSNSNSIVLAVVCSGVSY